MTPRSFHNPAQCRLPLGLAAFAGAWLLAVGLAWGAAQSFVARSDRTQVPLDDSFLFEVTLVLDDARATGYRPPNFKDFRVLGEHPSQSTQIKMGAGTTFMQVVYTWRYELQPLKTGSVTIGPAKVKIDGRDIQTSPVVMNVVEAMGGSARPATPPRTLPGLGGLMRPPPRPAGDGDGRNFVRVVPSKTKLYVGEQLTAEWYLYLTEQQDKYETLKEPHTDGFWVQDLPIAGNERGLSLTPQTYDGASYLVAPLLRRALFPLRSGSLTIAPLEAEISRVDFFGSTMRTQHIKADALQIEVMPLPKTGQPPNFDRAAVGRFSVATSVDRTNVTVGEPITVKLVVSGQGNIQKLVPPELPRLPGFKAYEPKVTVEVVPGEPVSGTKTVEVLLLSQKPGSVTLPAVSLAYFDPARESYATSRSLPITLTVAGDEASPLAGDGARPAPLPSAGNTAALVENVLPTELRPIRAKSHLRRDLGTTLYRSSWFLWLLFVPPLGFALTLTIGQVRQSLGQDTERRRGRRLRRQVRRRLRVAERHLSAGQKGEFFIEIDRTLRELLSAKLRRPISGLSMEEMSAQLGRAGLDAGLCSRVTAMLEECDRARFAPGSVSDDAMTTALDRAGELIVQLERTRLEAAAEGQS